MQITRRPRTKSLFATLLGVILLPLFSAEAQGQQIDPVRVAEGAAVYGSMCGRCHNVRSPLERTDREWVVIIAHMRVRANLTGGQVRDVLAFLQATNGQPQVSAAHGEETSELLAQVGDDGTMDDPEGGLSAVQIDWVLRYLATIR
jgi:mono/diheme cytochrome c family protein